MRYTELSPTRFKNLWRDWVFDPVLPADLHPADDAICRGVAVWHDATVAAEAACADRVFLGTNDARLIALDLATGKPCGGFGTNGEITLPPDVPRFTGASCTSIPRLPW